jgi:glycosyltransferase involved in cell wall biosynthesis
VIAYGIDVWGDLWLHDRWALQSADAIVSISEWTKKVLVERGYTADKISILHPMLAPFFQEQAPKTGFSLPEEPLKLLSISRLDSREQYKGQDHVLQALALLKDSVKFHYTIQGEGDDKPRLIALAKELGLENQVTFAPGVRVRHEFVESYRNADIFIMPSRYGKNEGEGFGIVYVEAAALGIPSIAYACGGVMDIVEDGKTGWLVTLDDIPALADTIRSCAIDRLEIARRGLAARQNVLDKFSKEAIHEELKSALHQWQQLAQESYLPSQTGQFPV